MNLFYHGTMTANIIYLNATSKVHDKNKSSVVYLTPNRAYALFYIRDMDINWVTCSVTDQGVIRYYEQFPNQLEILYKGISGYIYSCIENDTFEKTSTNAVWTADNKIEVFNTEYIHDVYDEIMNCEKSGNINIIRYESLTEDKKQDIHDMMIHYIYKNNLLNSTTKKAEFIRDRFPNAWNEAVLMPENRQVIIDE